MIEEEQDRFFDGEAGNTDIEGEDEYAAATPPLGVLDRSLRTREDLRSALAGVDVRWRRDVLMALENYVI